MAAPSCPSRIGGEPIFPSRTCRSVWQTPLARMRTRISPGPGSSTTIGSGFTGAPASHTITARLSIGMAFTVAAMAEWIYFIHPPRDDFAATMSDAERQVWSTHFERLKRLAAEGILILAGPTLGPVNTGIAVVEAPDEAAARRLMEEDPAIASGIARGELRPFRV